MHQQANLFLCYFIIQIAQYRFKIYFIIILLCPEILIRTISHEFCGILFRKVDQEHVCQIKVKSSKRMKTK